ncbi:hypothetical protein [Streptomyces hokutonensis]|uniref:hypothetical protein n=1 Tax=Streptomyces hokutonensis TaxID=1306990 RepID=UPI0033DAD4EB
MGRGLHRRRRVLDAFVQLADPERLLNRIDELRTELREAYDPFMHSVRVVVLEGPPDTAEAAQAVLESAKRVNRALWRLSCGETGARARFDEAQEA